MIVCDRCGSQTRPKTIRKKSTGEHWDVLECQGNCKSDKNPKYTYTFFPPKENSLPVIQTGAPKVVVPQTNGKAVDLLNQILMELKAQNKMLAQKLGIVHFPEDELNPDDEVPF